MKNTQPRSLIRMTAACALAVVFAAVPSTTLSAADAAATSVSKPAPFMPTPSPAQMRWHKAEYIMFAHYGMKTFHPSGNHLGSGKEDPKSYNPTRFDANQWVEAAKAGGFKGIVLTTKHHDGFCNWHTETTDHCVTSSPAGKDGQGDVVRELAEACRKGGIYLGLYVSIIDLHFEAMGLGKTQSYGDYYFEQLKELSTQYGPIDEYWFDGFNAAKLKMDYPKIGKMLAKTQPNAVIYDSGMLVKTLPDRCLSWPGHHGGINADQNYVKTIDGVKRWYPNEPSIILQGNWFHTGAPSVGVRQMQNHYLSSTGVGVTPLMNIPPNAEGLIDESTVVKLKEFKGWVDQLHSSDLARAEGVKVSATGQRGNSAQFAPTKVNDGDYDTYFTTDDGVTTATIEIELPQAQKIGGFILQEYIPLGQRIEAYSIECRTDGKWQEVFAAKRIGYKRIILDGRTGAPALTFNEGDVDVLKLDASPKTKKAKKAKGMLKLPTADAVRLKIRKSSACPLINNFQIIGVVE